MFLYDLWMVVSFYLLIHFSYFLILWKLCTETFTFAVVSQPWFGIGWPEILPEGRWVVQLGFVLP